MLQRAVLWPSPKKDLAVHALGEMDRYKAAARRMSGISDGSEHSVFKDLPPYPFDTEWLINE